MTTENTKKFSVLAYITIIGWIISFVKRDTNDPVMMQHINQTFVLNICQLLISFITQFIGGSVISLVLTIVSLVLLILWIMGLIRAVKVNGDPLPLVGGIKIFS